jgi:hypothetical protein
VYPYSASCRTHEKKVVGGGKKNERGSVGKGTENEKRSRMREKRKRARQTYIHTHTHTHMGTVSILFRRLLACASLLPRYCRRRRLFSNHNRLRVCAYSHQKFSTSLFLI